MGRHRRSAVDVRALEGAGLPDGYGGEREQQQEHAQEYEERFHETSCVWKRGRGAEVWDMGGAGLEPATPCL